MRAFPEELASVMPRMRKLALGALLLPTAALAAGESETIEQLRQEIEALKTRLNVLEEQVAQPQATQPQGEPLDAAIIGGERSHSAATTDKPANPVVHVGGALRFNLVHRNHVESSQSKRGETGLDVFRFNIDGELNNFLISAEYRFYSYMHTLHHGWIGYEFEDQSQLQVGVSRVPFGLLPYASHNAWFGVPYYVGLADDYDMGIKYARENGAWSTHLAFYKNEELNNPTSADRYAYDLVAARDEAGNTIGNEEINQINARMAYTFGLGSECEIEVGLSAQAGEVYNYASGDRGHRQAAALHMDSRCGRWNFQLQGASYEYDLANPPDMDSEVVQVGAFADTYSIPAKGDLWVANVAYNLPNIWSAVDSIICYNDYSRLTKSLSGARDSQINTLGCAIGMGPIFVYMDYILAKNATYFGSGSFARGGDEDWESRLNINIGYYW